MDWKNIPNLLLSTDSISGYWLDLVFQIAKEQWFYWIDLALWKNFDAWNLSYVKKLVEKYDIPVKVIQVSSKVNQKELNYAYELANEIWVDVINVNAPQIMDFRSYKFLTDNVKNYRKTFPDIKLSIINPEKSSLFMLPLPRYYFTNIVDVVKKYKFFLWLDIVSIEENVLETTFLKKMSNFLPYISTVYISDKSKTWVWHISLWEWVLKLWTIFKTFIKNDFQWYFSLKLDISKKDLADLEKVEQILKKNMIYYKEILK